MKSNQTIAAIDVGTTKVCTLIAHLQEDNQIEIIGVGKSESKGLKKGAVIDIEETVRSIKQSIDEAQLMSGVDIQSATVGIAGNHIYSFNSSGVVAIDGTEVTEHDIDRVLEAAKAVIIPSDREILHVIPQEYKLDNTSGIKDPLGMCGVRLEVSAHIVTGTSTIIQNLAKCLENSGIFLENLILQPIASSFSVLSSEEKEMGVVIVDIGGGTTDVAVWSSGQIVHSQVLPIGGNHFTNDLSVALKTVYKEAERIKIEKGAIFCSDDDKGETISVGGLPGTQIREVSHEMVSDVIRARANELFNLIKETLDEKDLLRRVNGGIVLTGGGSLLAGSVQLAEFVFSKPAKLGYPIPFGGLTNTMQNPMFATVLGLLLEGSNYYKGRTREESEVYQRNIINKLTHSLKNAFKEIF